MTGDHIHTYFWLLLDFTEGKYRKIVKIYPATENKEYEKLTTSISTLVLVYFEFLCERMLRLE